MLSRTTIAATVVMGVVVLAFLAVIPGSPVWRLLNRSTTVALPAASAGADASTPLREFEIRTVLGKDAIPAILDPMFVDGAVAASQMLPQELVIGLSINGDHRAYATAHLSSHEVVNDTVGGRPVMVTW